MSRMGSKEALEDNILRGVWTKPRNVTLRGGGGATNKNQKLSLYRPLTYHYAVL